MATTFAIVEAAASTSSSTQDFESSGFGQPDAAIIISNGATSNDGTIADMWRYSIGFTDGTNSRCAFSAARHNRASTSTFRGGVQGVLAHFGDSLFGSEECLADFDSWLTNGIRFSWSNNPSSAFRVVVVLIKGGDFSVGDQDTPSSGTGSVTNLGFEPQTVFFTSSRTSGADFSSTSTRRASHGAWSFGVANDNGSSIDQGSLNWLELQSQAAGAPAVDLLQDGMLANPGGGSSGERFSVEDFRATDNGAFTYRIDSGSSSKPCAYLACRWDGNSAHVGFDDTPTSTGENAYTDPGFSPVFGLIVASTMDAAGYANDSDAGAVALSAFTGTTDRHSFSVASEDAADTTNTQSVADSTNALNVDLDTGAGGYLADLSSLDSSGFTLDYTATDSTARKLIILTVSAVGATVGLSTSVTADADLTSAVGKKVGLSSSVTADADLTSAGGKKVGLSAAVTADADLSSVLLVDSSATVGLSTSVTADADVSSVLLVDSAGVVSLAASMQSSVEIDSRSNILLGLATGVVANLDNSCNISVAGIFKTGNEALWKVRPRPATWIVGES